MANSITLSDRLYSRAHGLNGKSRRNNVLHMAARDGMGIAGNEWDKYLMAMPCRNGIVDLKDGSLRDGTPKDYIRNVSPLEWKGLSYPAPHFIKFFSDILGDDETLIDFVHKLLGYAISGNCNENIFIVLYGPHGQNGKSTLLEIIKYALGDLAHSMNPNMFVAQQYSKSSSAPSPDILALRGKRIVWAAENEEGKKLATSEIKRLTGGDTLSGRQLYSGIEVNFTPTHTVFFLTNHLPGVSADDEAIFHRLRIIRFNYSFVDNPTEKHHRERDKELMDKLKTELPGILAWLVRGCIKYQKDGLNPPESVLHESEEYKLGEDVISQFIEERCEISESSQVKASILYKEYKEWSEEAGLKPLSKKEFGGRIKLKFKDKKISCIYYQGLKLKTVSYDEFKI